MNYYEYGSGGGPDIGNDRYPPEKPFSRKLRELTENENSRALILLGTLTGMGIILHFVMSYLFVHVISAFPEVYSLYIGDKAVGYIFDAIYSFSCVALPFIPVYIAEKKTGLFKGTLPLSLHADSSSPLLLILSGLGICYAGNILSSMIMQSLMSAGVGSYAYDQAIAEQTEIPSDVFMLVLTLIRTAIIPAFIEEFVFRGVIMQPLRKYGDWFAIITSAVVFGALHGNILQIPFAVIAGIALGYVSVVTGTMWTGIALHLMNNLLSVVYSMLLASFSGSAVTAVSFVMTYGVIAVGVIAFLIYVMKHRDFARLYPCEYRGMRFKGAYYFLAPTMVAGLAAVVGEIVKDIHH